MQHCSTEQAGEEREQLDVQRDPNGEEPSVTGIYKVSLYHAANAQLR